MPYQPLTAEQLDTLRRFALYAGRTWKAQLNTQWMNGKASGPLQQLRNSHGPSWLKAYRLPAPDQIARAATFQGPKSVCTCGHVGDGPGSAHAATIAPGHGPCIIEGCDCQKFSFARYTPEFERFMTPCTITDDVPRVKLPPADPLASLTCREACQMMADDKQQTHPHAMAYQELARRALEAEDRAAPGRLQGWPIIRLDAHAIFLRLPAELCRPISGGCTCAYCKARPELTPTWDTLGVPHDQPGLHTTTWTLHMPDPK